VIRLAVVANVLGRFLLGFAAVMSLPMAFGFLAAGDDPRPCGYAMLITAAAGGALAWSTKSRQAELSGREGLLLAAVVWFSACLFGALPFYFSPHFPTFADAFFESASGFTTTGATVLPKVEVLPPSIQFWRCGSHWLGGMGILVLVIAILPLLGAGGMHLYRAEFSGAKSDRLKPRVTETALSLWKIYLALTAAEFLALRLAGMNSFEAICHAFSTLGTGGFSTRTASVAGFNSAAIEFIIILFMLLAGVNFTRHYRLWVEREPRSFFRDPEIRTYGLICAVASVLIFASLAGSYEPYRAARAAVFQTASILTSTGFATEDFERWRPFAQLLLLSLMFVGGCTGSTAGGLKVARIAMLLRVVQRELRKLTERRGVFAVRMGGQAVPENAIQAALNIFYLAFMVNFVASLLLTATGVDVLTSISAVAACMFNVGPGLGSVGPAEHYGHLPALGKWVLSASMVAGRLEFYTLLVIFTPTFWRK
jgi:trk system potassium uptake protein TrkH